MLARCLAARGLDSAQAFGVWGFINKASLAVAAGVALPLIGYAGFAPGPGNTEAALGALTIAYAGAPCALKALAAADNGVPFYVALPTPTIDWTVADGVADIPIEQRDAREVPHLSGPDDAGGRQTVRLSPAARPPPNHPADVTPAPSRWRTGNPRVGAAGGARSGRPTPRATGC